MSKVYKVTKKGLCIKENSLNEVMFFTNLLNTKNVLNDNTTIEFNYCFKQKSLKNRKTDVVFLNDESNDNKIIISIIRPTYNKNLIANYPISSDCSKTVSSINIFDKIDDYIQSIYKLIKIHNIEKNTDSTLLHIDLYESLDSIFEIAKRYIENKNTGLVSIPFSNLQKEFLEGIVTE